LVQVDETIRISIITAVTKTTTRTTAAGQAEAIIEAMAPLLAEQRQRWAARCQARGISIIGFHALAILESRGSLPMSHLAEELGLALPNTTGIVGRMEERGLVARAHDDLDRRVVRVELTDAGHRLIAEMEAARRERMTRLIAQLDDEQQHRLLQSVRDLREAAAALTPVEATR
jgi:DNA-binding MarR family transcriptional regulator